MGVNPTPWGFSAYEEITEKLIAGGIPRAQIAAIGEADSDAKKQALFEKVRNGQVRVLIGSTQKMGTGTNVQKRLVALHHLDAPWKPAEVEQREGRILRQGNENEEVAIYRYVTEQSFDAYTWQALETKARFIGQIITDDSAVRRAEDIGGQELSYAEVKAIASGNPAVLTLAEADAELQRLAILRKNHADEQYIARRRLKELPEQIDRLNDRLAKLDSDMRTAETLADEPLIVGGRKALPKEETALLGKSLEQLPESVRETQRIPLGTFRGLRFGIVLHQQFSPDIYLGAAIFRQSSLSKNQGPRAVLNALENLAAGYQSECATVKKEVAIAESQLRDYRERLGAPFAHEAYFAELSNLRDQLKSGLSEKPSEPGDDSAPSVSDLSRRIKDLKDSQAIDAAPERIGKRRKVAEESVTSRIRRHREEAKEAEASATREGETLSTTHSEVSHSSLRLPLKAKGTDKESDGWKR